MLTWMRKNAGSWLVKVLLGAIILVFGFWGAGTYRSRNLSKAASVNGEIITVQQYQQAYASMLENFRKRFGNSLSEELLNNLNLKQRAINELIEEALLVQEAERLGFTVSDKQLAASIIGIPYFQIDGKFDLRAYRNILNANRLTTEQFENLQKRTLLIRELRNFVTQNAKVSEPEIKKWYDWAYTKAKIDYILFKPSNYKNQPTPKDSEIEDYFKKNQERYRTKELIKAQYLCFEPDSFIADTKITDNMIKEYYDSYIKTDSEDTMTLDKSKTDIKKILAQRKAKATAYDLAETVYDKVYSTADIKGSAELYKEKLKLVTTDYFSEKEPYKDVSDPEKFSAAAFDVPINRISDIKEIDGKYYIIKPIEKIPSKIPDLNSIKDRVIEDIKITKQDSTAKEEAEKLLEKLKNKADLKDIKFISTASFTRNESIPEIGFEPEISKAAFALSEENEIAQSVFKGSKGYYIFKLNKKEIPDPSKLKDELEEIKERLLEQKKNRLMVSLADMLKSKSKISVQIKE